MDDKYRKCSNCGKLKPITEFYTNHTWCKKCFQLYYITHKEQRKKYREEYYQSPKGKETKKRYYITHTNYLLKYGKEYRCSFKGKETRKKYYLNNREKILKQVSDWRKSPRGRLMTERYEQTPERKRYRKAVKETHLAIAHGDIVKPKFCELCGKERSLDSHHEDYSKPLQVVWLCSDCHGKRHSVGYDDIKKRIRMIYEKKYNVINKKVMVIPERRSDEIMPGLSNKISIR